jgi:hypothetical protein
MTKSYYYPEEEFCPHLSITANKYSFYDPISN